MQQDVENHEDRLLGAHCLMRVHFGPELLRMRTGMQWKNESSVSKALWDEKKFLEAGG